MGLYLYQYWKQRYYQPYWTGPSLSQAEQDDDLTTTSGNSCCTQYLGSGGVHQEQHASMSYGRDQEEPLPSGSSVHDDVSSSVTVFASASGNSSTRQQERRRQQQRSTSYFTPATVFDRQQQVPPQPLPLYAVRSARDSSKWNVSESVRSLVADYHAREDDREEPTSSPSPDTSRRRRQCSRPCCYVIACFLLIIAVAIALAIYYLLWEQPHDECFESGVNGTATINSTTPITITLSPTATNHEETVIVTLPPTSLDTFTRIPTQTPTPEETAPTYPPSIDTTDSPTPKPTSQQTTPPTKPGTMPTIPTETPTMHEADSYTLPPMTLPFDPVTPLLPGTRYAAQYVVKMEHLTDVLPGMTMSPPRVPKVQYLCKGRFQYMYAHRSIRDNARLNCIDIQTDDGFSGLECLHVCGDQEACSYWWNHDLDRGMATQWNQAGFWWECSGETGEETKAKFVWKQHQETDMTMSVPPGRSARNVKLARLEIRTNYTYSNQELIDSNHFPPSDYSMDYVVANTYENDKVEYSRNGAPDGGYYVWTGNARCQDNCVVAFEELIIESEPARFPADYIKHYQY